MVSAFQMQSFYRPAPLSIDTNQAKKYFEEEDHILDDSILDHSAVDSGLEMSPPMVDSRRDSFAVGSSLFSPKVEDWQSVDMHSLPSNNPFLEQPQQHSNNPFMRMDQPQHSPFGPRNNGWSMGHGSGSCTPMQQFDSLPTEYDASTASIFQRPAQGQTPFTNPTGQLNMFSSIGAGNQSTPGSPQKGWIDSHDAKKMRAGSPAIRSHNELRRGDGIRKKNARFEIPPERNLGNIDQLIALSNNEEQIKELKQQKRLLRNRQAA